MSQDPRTSAGRPERLDELLADRALIGLSSAEQQELEGLLAASGADEPLDLELSAAALDRALAPSPAALPAGVRARLATAALAFELPVGRGAHGPRGTLGASAARTSRPRVPVFALAGWLVAAAALVLAFFAWRPRSAPDLSSARKALLARAETLKRDWTATERAPGAGGDVAWSQDLQQGFLRLHALPANDPAREQYQLWIFDDAQEHPIDGGVFDVSGADALVSIDAKLRVQHPTLFAVTLEKPGGVVVSDQQRIVLVAKL